MSKKVLASAVVIFMTLLSGITNVPEIEAVSYDGYLKEVYTSEKYNGSMPYRLYVPEDYDPNTKYPLVTFLHGAGERGTDNEKHINKPEYITSRLIMTKKNKETYKCLIFAPQCPENEQWVDTPWANGNYSLSDVPESKSMKIAMELLDKICSEYSVDNDRLYITGMSMGGFGTWDAIMRYPNKFAAAAPVCGAADPSMAGILKEIPIRTYHGDKDDIVPVKGTRDMVKALEDIGGNIAYTEYKNVMHSSWVNAYTDRELLPWMFEQRLSSRTIAEPTPTNDGQSDANTATINPTSTDNDSGGGNGNNILLILTITVAAIILVVIGALIIMKKKHK